MSKRIWTEAFAVAGALVAVPAALAAHPHEGAGGLAHGLLHFLPGAGHALPAVAATVVAAAIAGGLLLVLRRVRVRTRRRAEARERR